MERRPSDVLSVTEQDRYANVLTRLQTDLAGLSSKSRHLTVAGADHYYTLVSARAHAAVVSDAISAVTAAAQSGRPIRELATKFSSKELATLQPRNR